MNKFRITQTRPLTNVLPYEVEECRQLWFLPWTVWRPLQERKFTGRSYRMTPRRFQTPQEAQVFTEQMLALRTSQEAEQRRSQDERHQRRQLPRVVQVLHLTVPV
ncbi:hypothetical protein GCM10028824_26330 [Hymenobacter segetis]|uniref:AP2/ERF domain-containing protein n=1 Tax=Hymenobacter segetis TaxID=2025509 RepID=A0ABU9LVM1_9BACT